jgi:hypothetical protein
MVSKPSYNQAKEAHLLTYSITGTFWLVNGTSQMPFFAVGRNYSPTGGSLEGETTPMFYATVGKYQLPS